MVKDNRLIINKLKEISNQGNLQMISSISSIKVERLNEIIDGSDITIPERIVLNVHLGL